MRPLADHDIAIVGIGCRLPQIGNRDELWELLVRAEDRVRPLPADHLAHAHYDPRAGTPGRTTVRAAALLEDATRFDHGFFGISPREARHLDPMFRIALETAWHAFEDALIAPDTLRGERIGVFMGAYALDHATMQTWHGDLRLVDAHTGPSTIHSMASGRISHTFDLHGPAVTVDTACSSSLVALHQAAAAIRAGECAKAVAGGVHLAGSPDGWVNLSLARMTSPDGRSKAFSADADGYGRGEGCVMLVLETVASARARGTEILAVIAGSAVEHDGRSRSITTPNVDSQQAIILETARRAGVQTSDVSFVEAHGTGTPTGDPIELAAIAATYGAADSRTLPVGSVKTNLGHLEAASGAAGVAKAVLSLRHRRYPRQVMTGSVTTAVDLTTSRVQVAVEDTVLPDGDIVGAVNSFGLSGTNAHIVVRSGEAAAAPLEPQECTALIMVAGATPAARARLASGFAAALRGGAALHSVARSSLAGRAALRHRSFVLARTADEAVEQLDALASGDFGGVNGDVRADGHRIAFVYPGQGAQRFGMGAGLHAENLAFRVALDEMAELLRAEGVPDVRADMFGDETRRSLIDRTDVTQPALFAYQYALTAALRAAGVVPAIVLGHSLGAFAAATAAGALTPEDAARIVARRGSLVQARAGEGAMVAVMGDRAEVEDLVSAVDSATLAVVNGDSAFTIAVPVADVETLLAAAKSRELATRRLPSTRAFHSAMMEPVIDAFGATATGGAAPTDAVFVSDTTGERVSSPLDAPYWVRHLREPVQFARAVKTALAEGAGVFVEIGPGATLTGLLRSAGATVASASSSEVSDASTVAELIARVLAQGGAVDRDMLARTQGGALVQLPLYPFEGETLTAPAVDASRERLLARRDDAHHGGSTVAVPVPGGWALGAVASDADAGLLDGHRLFGRIVVPGAYWVAQASALHNASTNHAGNAGIEIADCEFRTPLVLTSIPSALTVRTSADEEGFTLAYSRTDGGADIMHARMRVGDAGPRPEDVMTSAGDEMTGDAFYSEFSARGVDLAGDFRRVEHATVGKSATARLRGGAGLSAGLLDSIFQTVALGLPSKVTDALTVRGLVLVPSGFRSLRLWEGAAAGGVATVHVAVEPRGEGFHARADVVVRDEAGRAVIELRDALLTTLSPELLGAEDTAIPATYTVDWERAAPVSAAIERPAVRIEGDGELAGHVADAFRRRGWSVDATAADSVLVFDTVVTESDVDEIAARAFQVTDAVRRVGDQGRVRVVVAGGLAADGASPVNAAVAALTRTAASEFPQRFGGIADPGTSPTDDVLDELADRWAEPAPPAQLRWNGARAEAPVLRESSAASLPPKSFAGSWLVTGGLGAVGRRIAAMLLDGGADRVVLVSRGADHDTGDPQVLVRRADVADIADVRRLRSDLEAQGIIVQGIVHAAGVLDDHPLADLDAESFRRVLAAKAGGAHHLDEAFRDSTMPMILCSSIAGLFGTPAQGNYAAANAYLDAFARRRSDRGAPTVSIEFGPWAGAGMVASAGAAEALARSGTPPMRPGAALRVLRRALSGDYPVVAILEADWQQWRETVASAPVNQLLAGVVDGRQAAEDSAALHPDEVVEIVTTVVADTMQTSPEAVDLDVGLLELGIDSLMGIDIRSRVLAATGVSVPVALILGGASVRTVCSHIAEAQGAVSIERPERSRSAADLLAELDEMEPAELNDLLARLEEEEGEGSP